MPSIPSGGTAFRSTAILRVFTSGPGRLGHHLHAGRAGVEQDLHPLAAARAAVDGSLRVTASTWTLNRALMNCRAFSPCSGLREVMVTSRAVLGQQPRRSLTYRPGSRENQNLLPRQVPSVSSIFTTAATAVVLEPFESSMMETENGGNSAS